MPTISLIENLKSEAKALASDFATLFAYVISKHEFSAETLLKLVGYLSDPNLCEDAKTILLVCAASCEEFYFVECALVDCIVSGDEASAEASKEVLFKYMEENILRSDTLNKLVCLFKKEETTEIAKTILVNYVAIDRPYHDLDVTCGVRVKGLDSDVVALLTGSNKHIAENAKDVLLKLVSAGNSLSSWAQGDLIKLLKSKKWVRLAAKEILLKDRRLFFFIDELIGLLKDKQVAEAAKEILVHIAETKRDSIDRSDRYEQTRLLRLIAYGNEETAKLAEEVFLSYIHTIRDLNEDAREHWSDKKRIAEIIAKLPANADEDDNEDSDDE